MPKQIQPHQYHGAKHGDILFILSGDKDKVRTQLGALRVHVAENLGLKNPEEFKPLWVVDFPLLEWDEETGAFHAMHHPFTSPKPEQIDLIDSDPAAVRADAYDLVLNGNEIGGGSIRIHDKKIQQRMFDCLGFTKEEAEKQFGFLMNAFEYGAPPHGGIAFGLDRLVAIMGGNEIIRDFIAFPKNNSGRDVMIDSPSTVSDEQLKEINLKLWDIEDGKRAAEKEKKFDQKFIELARNVYKFNDERAKIKLAINTALGSNIKEVKSYE